MSTINLNVAPCAPVPARKERYSWLGSSGNVSTVLVSLSDGTRFRYGSIIGLHNGVEKIAKAVSHSEAELAQAMLFNGLSQVLRGKHYSGIGKVDGPQLRGAQLFMASRNFTRRPSLLFAVETAAGEPPVVFRAGICTANDYAKLLGIMDITQQAGKHKRS